MATNRNGYRRLDPHHDKATDLREGHFARGAARMLRSPELPVSKLTCGNAHCTGLCRNRPSAANPNIAPNKYGLTHGHPFYLDEVGPRLRLR